MANAHFSDDFHKQISFCFITSSETTTEVSKCDFYINPRERGRIWQHEERNQPSIYY